AREAPGVPGARLEEGELERALRGVESVVRGRSRRGGGSCRRRRRWRSGRSAVERASCGQRRCGGLTEAWVAHRSLPFGDGPAQWRVNGNMRLSTSSLCQK